MKSRLIVLGILLSNVVMGYAMASQYNLSVIEGASYVIIEGNEQSIVGGGIPASAQRARFYTASGDVVATVTKDKYDFSTLQERLDPSAPKPKPTSYAVKYWRAVQKGSPGYFIVFKDKHGNYIKSYRYNEHNHKIQVPSENGVTSVDSIEDLDDLDVRGCTECGSDAVAAHPEVDHSQRLGCFVQ